MILFCYTEFIYSSLSVCLARAQCYLGEMCAVWRVWEALCLKTDGTALGECSTMCAGETAVPV